MPWTAAKLFLSVTALFLVWPASAQSPASYRTTPALRHLVRQAGYIFAGRVQAIEPLAARSPTQVPTVRITFRVEQGIRGTQTGRTLTIREWAGLWNNGERYRVGESVVLFLHAPSRLGLTSPLGGVQGRYNIDAHGNVLLGTEIFPDFKDPERPRGRRVSVPLGAFSRAIRRAAEE